MRPSPRVGGPQLVARSHNGLAQANIGLGRFDDAHLHLAAARRLFSDLGDYSGQAMTAQFTAQLQMRQRLPEQALESFLLGVKLHEQAGDRVAMANTLNAVGFVRVELGDYKQGLFDCTLALREHRSVGPDRPTDGYILHSIGYALTHLGRHQEAADWYAQACAAFLAVGDRRFLAPTLEHLGDAQAAAGDPTAAVDAWRRAVKVFEQLDDDAAAVSVQAKIAAAGASS